MSFFQLHAKSYCFSLSSPLTGIFDPNGGFVSNTENFPRSIIYSVNKLNVHIGRLNEFNQIKASELNFTVGKLKNHLKYSTIESIKQNGLMQFLDEIKFELNKISNSINKTYFNQIL